MSVETSSLRTLSKGPSVHGSMAVLPREGGSRGRKNGGETAQTADSRSRIYGAVNPHHKCGYLMQ